MRIFIVDNGSSYINHLYDILTEHELTVIKYTEIRNNQITAQDLVILSGGHGLPVLWHENEYHNEIEFIKNHTGPIIGICLGFQLLAHVFGSHLHLLDEPLIGKVIIKPTAEGEFLLKNQDYLVYESHHWSAQKLKKPLITLAASNYGVELFKHLNKQIYGMQFHPESPNDIDGNTIFHSIIKTLT